MFRLLFTLYFAAVHAVGFLGVVLATEELAFMPSGQFLCYVRGGEDSKMPDHPAEPAGHTHPQGTAAHEHAGALDPDSPYFHCDPVPVGSPGNLLSVPFEVFELQEFSCRLEPQTAALEDRPAIHSQNRSPLTPPPKALFS